MEEWRYCPPDELSTWFRKVVEQKFVWVNTTKHRRGHWRAKRGARG